MPDTLPAQPATLQKASLVSLEHSLSLGPTARLLNNLSHLKPSFSQRGPVIDAHVDLQDRWAMQCKDERNRRQNMS